MRRLVHTLLRSNKTHDPPAEAEARAKGAAHALLQRLEELRVLHPSARARARAQSHDALEGVHSLRYATEAAAYEQRRRVLTRCATPL